MLAALRAAGAPTPEPLGLERRAGAACARIAWLPGARTLERWLAPWPALPDAPRLLARRCGEALAALHAAGLRQPDWHLGNLMLDRRGRFFAIDFHQARIVAFEHRRARAELASLGGEARERVPAALLATAALAWARALPADLARAAGVDDPAGRRALVEQLARESRAARCARVERHLDRWSRSSGRVASMTVDGERVLVARGASPERIAAIVRAARMAVGRPSEFVTRPLPTGHGPACTLVTGQRDEVARIWNRAARHAEHRLRGPSPLCHAPGPPAWAVLEHGPRPPDRWPPSDCSADRGLDASGPVSARAQAAPIAFTGPRDRDPESSVPISPRAAPLRRRR
ncbi:hypothetical protein Pla86_19740 [Planctomycetes bacterium Pla86]|uniref:Uncharacterized protein n=1 Tax=Engelhardtia mirabilis TaxID=2528011 RepID=A0A518BIU9_9BACT|nr:hypothetical protein Pla133_19740 [Planctomycetes bacterium Pla133]QDV01225.1 hypothetical protein Pla86_19740 [Planctomycetes bacterium Pla86]